MTATSRLHIAEQFLTSREVANQTLPDAPWQKELTPPREYVSDILIQGNYRTDAFSFKLNQFQKPEQGFLCAVISFTDNKTLETHFQDHPRYTEKISGIITDRGGIMSWLTPNVLSMAIPRPCPPAPMAHLASSIKKQMEKSLGVIISMGASIFPWMDFSAQETFHHGVRALDHAGFHKPGALIFPNPVTFNISGDRRYRLGHIDDALAEYRLGLLLAPTNFNLLNSLGVCNSVLNQFDRALDQFEKALEIMPKDVMALYNAGLVCNLMNHLDKGAEYLTRASKLNNTIFEIELTAGILFTKANRFSRALDHLERAGKISPGTALPHGLMGDIHLKQGDCSRAVKSYTRAIKCNARDTWSMSGLARIYEIQNINMDIAMALARQSVMLDPGISLFRHRLGKIYLKKGWYEKAAIEFNPKKKPFNLDKGVA
ncbi:Tetratricopeptide repeat-containing protein [Desulfocicer vacuolatum DSM 3385]|uniref:Tetratricopeptide repeat-containing protein n=2 Tax=Desulfocicer vacuolatum TaxID=2298 RepID=A0A1W1YHU2_9BACT|nr:Tetratricopeptide repeat-containing protein [Desulfocicer vacuolatum DSM 3385]